MSGLLLARLREPGGDPASQLFPGVLAPVAAATTSFSDSGTGVTVISATATNVSGSGRAVYGQSDANNGTGISGYATNLSGFTKGANFTSDSIAGTGVYGYVSNLSGNTRGVQGDSASIGGVGVLGAASNASGSTYGVRGESSSIEGRGVYGIATNFSGATRGVYGKSDSIDGIGVSGLADNSSGFAYGVQGESHSINGRGVVGLASNLSGTTFAVHATNFSISGTGVLGVVENASGVTYGVVGESKSITGLGVVGNATNASGASYGAVGISNSIQGIGVAGVAGRFGTKPMVAQGASGQTASLQEWQNSAGTALAVVDANGRLGLGTGSPARSIHLRNNSAVFRMDRDVNSSAFILTRTALGDFSTIWKTFYVGVDASGVDNGSFFVGDRHQFVSGDSDKRLIVDNTGRVGVGRTPTGNNLEVEGTASKTTAGDWLANSDMRIKTDIHDIDDALVTIRKLHPVRFRYADWYRAEHPSIKDHSYYNFVAQEYREVFPDSVKDNGEGLLQMDSYNVTPYTVRGIQELAQQNEELAIANKKLREAVQELQVRVGKLETN